MADKLSQVTFDAVEGRIPSVTAAFDPATLVIVKPVAWSMAPSSTGDKPELRFSRASGRRLAMTLSFEASAIKLHVQPDLDALMRLAMVIDANGAEDRKRPPLIEVAWSPAGALPAFRGVFDRIEIRYLALQADGTPQKAEADIEMEEASVASFSHH